jgi:threonine dehydratase
MRRSLDEGHAVTLPRLDTIADGLAAPMAGPTCYAIVRELVDDVVLVTDEEIAEAMSVLLMRCKILAEPAGAAATAALLTGKVSGVRGKRVVSVVSGGNVDLEKLKALT